MNHKNDLSLDRRNILLAGATAAAASTVGAVKRGWTVVDMKQDWKKVFAFEP